MFSETVSELPRPVHIIIFCPLTPLTPWVDPVQIFLTSQIGVGFAGVLVSGQTSLAPVPYISSFTVSETVSGTNHCNCKPGLSPNTHPNVSPIGVLGSPSHGVQKSGSALVLVLGNRAGPLLRCMAIGIGNRHGFLSPVWSQPLFLNTMHWITHVLLKLGTNTSHCFYKFLTGPNPGVGKP
jgi:hypothetical protein